MSLLHRRLTELPGIELPHRAMRPMIKERIINHDSPIKMIINRQYPKEDARLLSTSEKN